MVDDKFPSTMILGGLSLNQSKRSALNTYYKFPTVPGELSVNRSVVLLSFTFKFILLSRDLELQGVMNP